jgi:hypothetical protein
MESDNEFPPGLTPLGFEEQLLRSMLDHHYSYGHHGFLSERTTLSGIFSRISDTEYMRNRYEHYANPVNRMDKRSATGETLEEVIREVEALPEFVSWAYGYRPTNPWNDYHNE